MLTQKDIIDAISDRIGVPAAKTKAMIDTLIDLVALELAAERDCRIHGFGTFKAVKSQKRIGRNPASGDAMKIPAKIRIRFRPGYRLKAGADTATQVLKLHEIAKLMVSELLLYNSPEIDRGIRENNLEKILEDKLKDARENFSSRIPKGIDADISIFEHAWEKFIDKRKKALETMK
ncbi:HU family DNA-binding protein [bacterium]|nr:HU family DNA-binding protein [candidate division CSSED10-310 bacterium]